MPDERIQIIYDTIVRNSEKIDDLTRKMEEARQTTNKQTEASARLTAAETKQESMNLKLRHGILAFRKEMFAAGVVIGTVIGGMNALSKTSDGLENSMSKVGVAAGRLFRPLAESIDQLFSKASSLKWLTERGVFDSITGAENSVERTMTAKSIDRLRQLQIDSARLRGNSELSVNRSIALDRAKLMRETETLNERQRQSFTKMFEEIASLRTRDARLAEFGLERQALILKQLKLDIATGLRSETGNVFTKLFSGEKQTGGDILKGFQGTIGRALGDALSKSLFTFLLEQKLSFKDLKDGFISALTGKNPVVEAVKESNAKLSRIENCICRTAENTAAIAAKAQQGAPMLSSISISGGGSGVLGKIAAISGGIGSLGGLKLPGNIPAPKINIPDLTTSRMIDGISIPHFAEGGEVPAVLHSGEFVVNRKAATDNKDLLRDINAGGGKRTSQNVFMIRANDANSFVEMLSSAQARDQIEIQLIRSVMSNGNIRRVIRDFAR